MESAKNGLTKTVLFWRKFLLTYDPLRLWSMTVSYVVEISTGAYACFISGEYCIDAHKRAAHFWPSLCQTGMDGILTHDSHWVMSYLTTTFGPNMGLRAYERWASSRVDTVFQLIIKWHTRCWIITLENCAWFKFNRYCFLSKDSIYAIIYQNPMVQARDVSVNQHDRALCFPYSLAGLLITCWTIHWHVQLLKHQMYISIDISRLNNDKSML